MVEVLYIIIALQLSLATMLLLSRKTEVADKL
jgi:hypothetical protein